jgi:hypothetical protein
MTLGTFSYPHTCSASSTSIENFQEKVIRTLQKVMQI